MFFDLNAEQKQVCDTVDRLLADIIDPNEMVKGADAVAHIASSLEGRLAEVGLQSMIVAEADGGAGLGLLSAAAISHLFGWHAAPTAILEDSLAAWALSACDAFPERADWLQALMTGEKQISFAVCDRDETWLPSGDVGPQKTLRKLWASARPVEAYLCLYGNEVLLVPAGGAAVEATGSEPLDMSRPLVSLHPDRGNSQLIGTGAMAERLVNALLVLAASDAAGAGRRALHLAVQYSMEREQFGRKIGSFQALKHQLANMAVDIEPVQFLCWYAAQLWDSHSGEESRICSLAKAHACDMAVRTGRAAVEAHGSIGYTWEYPLHLFLKRAMQDRVMFGSPASLRRRVAALSAWQTSQHADRNLKVARKDA